MAVTVCAGQSERLNLTQNNHLAYFIKVGTYVAHDKMMSAFDFKVRGHDLWAKMKFHLDIMLWIAQVLSGIAKQFRFMD